MSSARSIAAGFTLGLAMLTANGAEAALTITGAPTQNVTCASGVCTATAQAAVLNATALANMLASSNVTVVSGSTAQDIVVRASFSWTSSNRLTLDAYHSIMVDYAVAVTGPGAVTLTTNDGGSGGSFSTQFPGRVDFWDLSSSLIINGASYTLVNDISTLAADIAGNASGRYALAKNYDASPDGTYGASPVPTIFAGAFDGLGHIIEHLSIRSTKYSFSQLSTGLFSQTASGGAIQNIGLTEVEIHGAFRNYVGALVALNEGSIVNAFAKGHVQGKSEAVIGALVGANEGSIVSSYTTGQVSAEWHSAVGGLAGGSNGSIRNSHSSAEVGAAVNGSDSAAGGLVGSLAGLLSTSWASGAVTVGDSRSGKRHRPAPASAGGLVGSYQSQTGGITNCYATGSTTGGYIAGVGGLVGAAGSLERNSPPAPVTDSYATGRPTATRSRRIGGFVGYMLHNESFTDAYWDMDTSGTRPRQSVGNKWGWPGITGLSNAQLTSGLPAGFDPTVWAEKPRINGGWPYLDLQPTCSVDQRIDEGRQMSSAKLILSVFAIGGAMLNSTGAQATLVIGSAPTKNVVCAGGVCTATVQYAVLNANALAGMLASSDVSVISGSIAKDILVRAPFSWTSRQRLTLDAYRSITTDHAVTVAGSGAVTLTTNDGGSGGTFSTQFPGRVDFRDLSSSLVINGASYTLVGDIATLAADIATNASGHYALAKDYDASVNGKYRASPIPTTLDGTFEGLGHLIKHLTIRSTAGAALFSAIDEYAQIENIGLTTVRILVTGKQATVGALVAVNRGAIADAFAEGTISGSDPEFVGGLVGVNDGGSITSSYTTGEVMSGGPADIGGLVGGSTLFSATIRNSHSTADVIGGSEGAGGLVGFLTGSLTNSWASGTVKTGYSYAGGLVGRWSTTAGSYSSLENCYATGNAKAHIAVGGLVGQINPGGDSSQVLITNSYATGQPTGASYSIGGLLGDIEGQRGSVSNTYWDTDTSGITDPSQGVGGEPNAPGVTGLSDSQLTSGLPAGFDPTVWAENPNINGGRPYLIDNPPAP